MIDGKIETLVRVNEVDAYFLTEILYQLADLKTHSRDGIKECIQQEELR